MTCKERILATISGNKPDRVPICPEIARRFANKVVGRFDWRGVLQTNGLLGCDAFNFQGTESKFNVHWRKRWNEKIQIVGAPEGRIMEERKIRTPHGLLVSKTTWNYIPGDPLAPKIVEYLIKQRQDYETYLEYLEEWLRRAESDLSESIEAAETIGDQGVLNYWITDEFYSVGNLRGMQEYLLDFYEAPDLMKEVLAVVRRVKEFEIEAFNESPAEVLIYDCCWASTSVVGPDFFREWVLPGLKWAVDTIARDKYVGFFISGKIKSILPLLVQPEPDFITPFDVLGDVSMGDVKARYGDRVCIMGNMSPVILARGSVEDTRQETLRCLEEAAEGGRYILGTSDEVPADAKIENMRTMVKVASAYKY